MFALRTVSRCQALARRACFSSTSVTAAEVNKVGVIGMGLMGHGIAQTAAAAGYTVVGVEMQQDALDRGMGMIETSLGKVSGRAVKKGKLSQEEADAQTAEVQGRLSGSTDLGSLADCDLIIEAIVEDYEVCSLLPDCLGLLRESMGARCGTPRP